MKTGNQRGPGSLPVSSGAADPEPPDRALGGEQVHRLLGLVFAAADLVLEVDGDGRIAFALGAAEGLAGRSDEALAGMDWTALVHDADRELLRSLMESLGPGERVGPLRVRLAHGGQDHRPPRQANLSLFRMPERASRLSCALSLGGRDGIEIKRAPDGLVEAQSFPAAAAALVADAQRAGVPVRLDLVEMAGLSANLGRLEPDAAAAARGRLAAVLRAESYAGVGASEMALDRFALVRPAASPPDRLADRLAELAGPEIEPAVAELALDPGAAPALNARAVRFALDRFIAEGPAAAAAGFSATVGRLVSETTRFQSMLAAGTFSLAYQPVLNLADRSLHHFEALARFDGDSSPAETIRLAEALEMILDFDLAVARSVAKVVAKGPGELKVAMNVSAVSLLSPRFVGRLLEITAAEPLVRRRLLLEVTETSRLDDLAAADRIIAELRRAGYVLCIDDFGAGAASLDYLRQLTVDFVKIDGRFIQALTAGSREALVLRHIADLCRDLKVSTIAEMVETEEAALLARSLGVALGQGWAFGRPSAEPRWEPPGRLKSQRRLGAADQWR
jgi:EAL domain-containing protein (putative c-di-GMP-specific phosphodiesterase class I)